jgi:hypothetical protein
MREYSFILLSFSTNLGVIGLIVFVVYFATGFSVFGKCYGRQICCVCDHRAPFGCVRRGWRCGWCGVQLDSSGQPLAPLEVPLALLAVQAGRRWQGGTNRARGSSGSYASGEGREGHRLE